MPNLIEIQVIVKAAEQQLEKGPCEIATKILMDYFSYCTNEEEICRYTENGFLSQSMIDAGYHEYNMSKEDLLYWREWYMRTLNYQYVKLKEKIKNKI